MIGFLVIQKTKDVIPFLAMTSLNVLAVANSKQIVEGYVCNDFE